SPPHQTHADVTDVQVVKGNGNSAKKAARAQAAFGGYAPKFPKKAPSEEEIVANETLIHKFEEAESLLPKNYVVLGMLGEGGMAAVFKVRDKDGKLYAAKLLAPDLIRDESSMKRFEQEAQAAERLHHPGIAGIREFGTGKGGAPYLVMSYMPGLNLAEFL